MFDMLSPRLAVRPRPGEILEIERVLAVARVGLALSSLVALRLYPIEAFLAQHLVFGLVLLYTGHAIALLVLLSRWSRVPPQFCFTIQMVDILWPCLISIFTTGYINPFFLYFIFALLAAAFRWGMRESLLAMAVAIVAVEVEALEFTHPRFSVPGGTWLGVAFLMRIAYLIIFGLLIGYLAESEKRRRAEAWCISQISSKARVDAGLRPSLQGVLQELLKVFGAREALLLTRESGAGRAYLWQFERAEDNNKVNLAWRALDDSEAQPYLLELPAQGAGTAWVRGKSVKAITIDRDGNRLRGWDHQLPHQFVSLHPFSRMLTTSILFAPDLSCRMFVFEPSRGGSPRTQLRFLRDLTNRVAPVIYNVYLLRRLRSRAAAAERARVARELHDGVVQSLHALAFRLYALRTGSNVGDRERRQELLDLQELVQKEASHLRSMIQHLQPIELDPRQLIDILSGIVERYRYDTGIAAKFVCQVAEVNLPPTTCREVAGIVQEALANVLKHSGAESVLVCLTSQDDAWMLTIEDDGRGFEFSGRLTQLELERIRRGPLIIKQRARAIGGELTVESRPGQGARLEIRLPQTEQANIA